MFRAAQIPIVDYSALIFIINLFFIVGHRKFGKLSTAMQNLTVQCQGVSKAFETFSAVQEVTLNVCEGEIVTLVGPSGCGKTTLLRLIAGFERVDAGTVSVKGRVVARRGLHVPPEKRRIGGERQRWQCWHWLGWRKPSISVTKLR